MKTIWIISFLLINTLLISAPSRAQESGAADIVMQYLAACRNGDIDEIKTLIAGPLYVKKSALLNGNKAYSDFLIDQFKGVNDVIISEAQNGQDLGTEVIAERQYPNGSSVQMEYIVKHTDNLWKIYDEKVLVD